MKQEPEIRASPATISARMKAGRSRGRGGEEEEKGNGGSIPVICHEVKE